METEEPQETVDTQETQTQSQSSSVRENAIPKERFNEINNLNKQLKERLAALEKERDTYKNATVEWEKKFKSYETSVADKEILAELGVKTQGLKYIRDHYDSLPKEGKADFKDWVKGNLDKPAEDLPDAVAVYFSKTTKASNPIKNVVPSQKPTGGKSFADMTDDEFLKWYESNGRKLQ